MSSNSCMEPPNCNFEDLDFEFCSWLNSNSSQDQFAWILYSSNVSSPFGLLSDNTIQNSSGHFALASAKTKGMLARLFSQNLYSTSDSGACLSFFYYFNGGKYYLLNGLK
jgi:hypothetical protein